MLPHLTRRFSRQSKGSRFLHPQKIAPLLPAADLGVMCLQEWQLSTQS